ncbi:hypothetical protein BSPLISOX_1436 [uncultured Gammaproteobacteria bacterium]|jgi:hypothetical protein|nr:hypothetical protein BSPLISOX_1436 [uncultured Gammaproteobacteria bacterium]
MIIDILMIFLTILTIYGFFQYEEWFLNSRFINNKKCKSKKCKFLKFIAKVYFFPEVKGGSYVNINLPKNKEIFGIGYLRMSLFVFIIVFGTIVLFHGYSHNQEMNFINGNNPNLITVTGKLNKVRNKNKKAMYIYIEGHADNPLTVTLKRINNTNLKKYIGQSAYIKKYYVGLKQDKRIALLKINNETLISLNDTKNYVGNKNNKLIYGYILIILGLFLPWWRYRLYGFNGIDELIQVDKEIKKRGLNDMEALDNIEEIINTVRQNNLIIKEK